MADNPISKFLSKRLIEPAVDQATSELKKELSRTKEKLEYKEFDLLTSVANRFSGIGTSKRSRQSILDAMVSWSYANISAIAERVADIQFEMYRYTNSSQDGDKVEELETHPALEILLRVNDYQTKWDLIYLWALYMMSMGEAAWYLVGMKTPNSTPTEIWPLRPDFLKVIPGDLNNNQFIKRYDYEVPGKPKISFNPWEIIFFRVPHPTNAYRGYGVLEAASADVDIDEYANNYNRGFFANFARPDSVLYTDNKLSEEVYTRLLAAWQSKYGGVDNAGKTAILEQGLKYMAIQPTAKDMDFLEQQRWTRDKLMAMFRNTKVILGITEDVNRANAEASESVWIKHTIKPKMQRLVDILNEFFVPLFGSDIFLGFEDPSPESTELKLSEYTQGLNRWLTTNEIRAREGLDPVQGGDTIYMPLAVQPLGVVETGTAPTEPPMNDDGEKIMGVVRMPVLHSDRSKRLLKRFRGQVAKMKNSQARNKALMDIVMKTINKALKAYSLSGETVAKFASDGSVDRNVQELHWKEFVKFTSGYERLVAARVRTVLEMHEKETLRRIKNSYTPEKALQTKSADELVPTDPKYVKASLDALLPVLTELALKEGEDIYQFLGIDQPFDFRQALQKKLRDDALASSESYVGDVRQRIVSAIAEGTAEGESIPQLAERVRAAYSTLSNYKATMVARTETIRAANAAKQDAFDQSGVVTGKQWLTAEDERVDDECAALDGKIVELDQDFTTLDGVPADYQDVGYPPLHPNCRCTLSPIVVNKRLQALRRKQQTNRKKKMVKRQATDQNSTQKFEQLKNIVEAEVAKQLDVVIETVKDDGSKSES